MFNLVLKFVRLQPVASNVANFSLSRLNQLITRKILRSSKLNKKTKVVKESNFSLSESQLLFVTVSNGSKYNMVSLCKQLG